MFTIQKQIILPAYPACYYNAHYGLHFPKPDVYQDLCRLGL